MGSNGEDDDENWWRPPWETDEALDPPGAPLRRATHTEPDYSHPLLPPLARAQDALARLETRMETASEAVAEGLRARMAYCEAAGWLARAYVWIHPQDLALRDSGITGSYGAAARAGRLDAELPVSFARGSEFEAPPADIAVDQALRFARAWRRLAEHSSWKPIADGVAMRETLEALGSRAATAVTDIEDWLGLVHLQEDAPALILAGRAARDWMNRPQTDPQGLDGPFLAACLWREKGYGRPISLPFWTAPELRHNRLGVCVGVAWLSGFLECVADAAKASADELVRLQRAEDKGRLLPRTARSRLADALEAMLRAPIVTARGLAKMLDVTPQAALGLIRQLCNEGLAREVTGRSAWRAFVLA